MAFAYNPFSEAGRDRRLTDPRPYSQAPGGVVNPQVDNPSPQQEVVGSQANQLQPDMNIGRQVYEPFQDGYIDLLNSGLGFMGLPTPQLTATSERDQTNGDYISQGYTGDWSGVQDWLRPMQELFLEPVVGRQNASIAAMNAERERVRQVTQPQTYQTQREVQNIDPQTGRRFSTFVDTTKFNPNFQIESLFL